VSEATQIETQLRTREVRFRGGKTFVFRQPTLPEWDTWETMRVRQTLGIANRQLAQSCLFDQTRLEELRALFEVLAVAPSGALVHIKDLAGCNLACGIVGEEVHARTFAGDELRFRAPRLPEWEGYQEALSEHGRAAYRLLAAATFQGEAAVLDAHFADAPGAAEDIANGIAELGGAGVEEVKKGA
jgi:hypothetical protein